MARGRAKVVSSVDDGDVFDVWGTFSETPTKMESPVKAVEVAGGRRRILDCGHFNFDSESDHEAARAEGYCCVMGKSRSEVCHSRTSGEYATTIPPKFRRTVDRERTGGFGGYCADPAGWYIGGVGNDCRFYSPNGLRCAYHEGWGLSRGEQKRAS